MKPSRRVAVVVAVGIAVLLVIVRQVAAGRGLRNDDIGLSLVITVPFTVLGVLILMSSPRHPVGRLMVAAGVFSAVDLVAVIWPLLTGLAQVSWLPSLSSISLALLLFPDGRLPSPRWWPVAAAIVAGTVVALGGLGVAALDQPTLLLDLDVRLRPWAQGAVYLAGAGAALAALGYLGVLQSLWLRWRRSSGDPRRQLACLLPAAILFPSGLALSTYGVVETAWAFAGAAVPLGMAVAILRYRLYDVDLIINRTIVWILMTALVVVGVIAIVRILSYGLFNVDQTRATLLATGVAVVTVEPLHRRVQRGVNRLLYGDRDDPYLVIARLGEVLGRTVDPTAVMPLVTGTIAHSLQVPYVAVELHERGGPVLVAEHGRPLNMTESFDMVSHGKRIGRLLVGRRSTGSRFTRHECRLLGDVAVQAAVAAAATQLNRELQTSRERLVTAREEERRRLRRDLHDGVGPSLAGMSMQVRAARRLLPSDSRAAEILDALAGDLKSCTVEIRQVVDELRPPVLDRGLSAALRAECKRFDGVGVSVRCHVQGDMAGLPAAVEVAAFRIVAEALTNMARHSRANNCHVAVHRNGALRLEVVDDGVGLEPSDWAGAGVGVSSMRERAAELGGDCIIGPAPGQGTSVRVELPLGPAGRYGNVVGDRVEPGAAPTSNRGKG